MALAVVAALPSAARAVGWRYADWGMTPAQVIAASGGDVSRDAALLDAGENRQELEGGATVLGVEARLVFGFVGGRLADVTLSPVDPTACPAFKAQLDGARGAPRRTESLPGKTIYHWHDDVSGADVALTEVGGDDLGCQVVYRPEAGR